eukprot:COSAG02_NODE_3240_length_7111_cov_9.714632_3_plen_613_part_00
MVQRRCNQHVDEGDEGADGGGGSTAACCVTLTEPLSMLEDMGDRDSSRSLSLLSRRGERPYSRERAQLQRTTAQARTDARKRAREQVRPGRATEGFEKAREVAARQLPLDQARRLLQKPDTAATTRLYSASGVSSQYWLNPTSRHSLVDILGVELAGNLRRSERAALVAMQRRAECDAALAHEQRKLAETCEKLAAEAAAAEENEVRAVFQSIDLDDNGTLERDELKTAAERLGQTMSEEELDAAMLEMDEDGSGEVDYDEFLAWWDRRKAEGKGGLFGGLFSDPLEMSDDYLRMQIVIDKRKREAAQASAEGASAAESLEAVSLDAGLRLRAFAEFERQHQLLDEQGGGVKSASAAQSSRQGVMRIGSAGAVRKSSAVARGALLLGRPKSAGVLLRDAPSARNPNAQASRQQQPPAFPPTLRLAASTAGGGPARHNRISSDQPLRRQPVQAKGSPVSRSSSFADSLASSAASSNSAYGSPTLEAPGATVLGTGPVLQKRLLRSKTGSQGGGRDSFVGLFNSSPWEQRRREGESTRKMREKFAEFHAWYGRNATSLIAEWVAVDAAAQPQGKDQEPLHWAEGGQKHQERTAGRAWSSYQELSEQCGPALTTK